MSEWFRSWAADVAQHARAFVDSYADETTSDSSLAVLAGNLQRTCECRGSVEAGTPAAEPEPLYRRTAARRGGQGTSLADDLAEVERLIAEASPDYPGLPFLRRRRDELAGTPAAELAPDAQVVSAVALYCGTCGSQWDPAANFCLVTGCAGQPQGIGVVRAIARAGAPTEPADDTAPTHCPRCESPQPHLHPAVQNEGEVQPCSDPWHATSEYGRDVLARLRGDLVGRHALGLLDKHGPNLPAALAGPADDTTCEAQP